MVKQLPPLELGMRDLFDGLTRKQTRQLIKKKKKKKKSRKRIEEKMSFYMMF